MVKVCFFGASVCEQTFNHSTGDLTGFISYMESVIDDYSCYDICRIASGSSTIDDAGISYVNRVVETGCDICVLDWTTPYVTDCQEESINFIYSVLADNGILPVTVVLPRADRIQNQTSISIKLRSFCEKYGFPYFDYSSRFSEDIIKQFLRDSVHTNEFGAKLYGDYMFYILNAVLSQKALIPSRYPKQPYFVTSVDTDNLKNRVRKLNIELRTQKENRSFKTKFLLEQRVGQWSSFLDIKLNSVHVDTVNNFDQWCYRERQCIKPLTNFIENVATNSDIAKFEILVSDKQVDYGSLSDRYDFNSVGKEIRPKGRLYCITDTPVELRVY